MTSLFGHKLRQHRHAVGLTLEQLAHMSGLSPALLSQIERGLTSPSLRTLSKLRRALRLPSSFFFEDDLTHDDTFTDPPYICRAHDRPRVESPLGVLHTEMLHHQNSDALQMMIVEVFPEKDCSDPESLPYPSEKGGVVLQGELELTIAGRSSRLAVGDSFLFDGELPHHLANPLPIPLRLLWVIARKSGGTPI